MSNIPMISVPRKIVFDQFELLLGMNGGWGRTQYVKPAPFISWTTLNSNGTTSFLCGDDGFNLKVVAEGRADMVVRQSHLPSPLGVERPKRSNSLKVDNVLTNIINTLSPTEIKEVYTALHKAFDFCRIYRD